MTASISTASADKATKLRLTSQRAHEQWNAGMLKSAFRLFLLAAKDGDVAAQVNLGNFYDDGIGVKPNQKLALYWYGRAYRRGYAAAANNIAVLHRNRGCPRRALSWFQRAVGLGDIDANLEIARLYLEQDDRDKAVSHLNRVSHAQKREVTSASREEARALLKRLT